MTGIQAAIASGAVTIGFRCDRNDRDMPKLPFYADNYTEIANILSKIG